MLAYLLNMIRKVVTRLDNTNVTFDYYRRLVRISNFRCKFVLSCYKKYTLLRLLVFTTGRVSLKPSELEHS